jgi:uncharacterized protein YkwD
VSRARAAAPALAAAGLLLGAVGAHAGCDEQRMRSARHEALRQEINRARTDPAAYAAVVREYFAGMDARGGYLLQGARVQSREGRAAVNEAVAYLHRAAPLPALQPAACLAQAAQAHADDQARSGEVGHQGGDGSGLDARVRRHGVNAFSCGENIAYGQPEPRDVVVALLVDDGVPTRGHRANLFDRVFTRLGVGRAEHPRFGIVTVQVMCGPEGPG